MAINLSASFQNASGGQNGASVTAWLASGHSFSGRPTTYTPLPTGSPDAGPVTTSSAYGQPGTFSLTLPSNSQYYLAVTFNSEVFWFDSFNLNSSPGPCYLVSIDDVGSGSSGSSANSVLYAGAYGVIGGTTAAATTNTSILNDLMKLAELQGTTISLPVSNGSSTVFTNKPFVQRKGTGFAGVGGTVQTQSTVRLAPLSNCSVRQFQRYIPGVLAFDNSGATTYATAYGTAATSFATYNGNLYACLAGYTPSASPTPDQDPQHWQVLCPVNQTTFNNSGATINQTPQSLVVTDGTQFGQFGGIMQFTVSSVTYSLLYTGVLANTVLGCTIASGSVTIAGTEAIFPQDVQNTSAQNVTLHGGFANTMSPGRFDPVDMYSSGTGGDFNFNVTAYGGSGDGWGGLPLGGSSNAYNGSRVWIGCTAQNNAGTGRIGTTDSYAVADVCGANGLGGHLLPVGPMQVGGKSWNNGRQSIWKAMRFVTDGVANGTTTFTSATANFVANDIGQGIYDSTVVSLTAGSSTAGQKVLTMASTTGVAVGQYVYDTTSGHNAYIPANTTVVSFVANTSVTLSNNIGTNPNGDTLNFFGAPGSGVIPAGTFILNVVNSTTVTLSQAAGTGSSLGTSVAGYYAWPLVAANAVLTGSISPDNGIFYVNKNAITITGTAPELDTTNWQPIRTVQEWGWSATETNSCTENRIDLDCQADKFGAYNAVNSISTIAAITANGWISNPWAWNGTIGAAVGAYSVPTNLQAAGCVNLGSSVGHNVRVAARQSVSSSLGTLVQAGSATRCSVTMTTDGKYNAVLGGVLQPSNSVVIDGVTLGPTGTPLYGYTSLSYYPTATSSQTISTVQNDAYATPMPITTPHVFTTIAARTAVGAASTVVQFAIYTDNGNTPVGGQLVWSSNGTTVAAASSTTVVTQGLGSSVSGTAMGASFSAWQSSTGINFPIGMYWLVVVPQGVA